MLGTLECIIYAFKILHLYNKSFKNPGKPDDRSSQYCHPDRTQSLGHTLMIKWIPLIGLMLKNSNELARYFDTSHRLVEFLLDFFRKYIAGDFGYLTFHDPL